MSNPEKESPLSLGEPVRECLCKNFNPECIIAWKNYISHDGYDDLGPKSNLYDLHVLFKNKKGILKIKYFYAEDYFDGKKVYFIPILKKVLNLSLLLQKKSIFTSKEKGKINESLLKKFPDLVSTIILEFLVKEEYEHDELYFSKKGNYLTSIDDSGEFNRFQVCKKNNVLQDNKIEIYS